jgi:hypothetical protein
MSDVPHRTVVILRDRGSALHYLRCAVPCGEGGGDPWCQFPPKGAPRRPGICWLGSAPTREGCEVLATRWGYTVIEPPPEASPGA